MILVDTSVWIAHVREHNNALAALLSERQILVHPFVIGEIALGHLRSRDVMLSQLRLLLTALIATNQEVLHLIEHHKLAGSGVGYVDAHLLASASLIPDAKLWTIDKNLHTVAKRLSLAYEPSA